jgi:hypothetical protein
VALSACPYEHAAAWCAPVSNGEVGGTPACDDVGSGPPHRNWREDSHAVAGFFIHGDAPKFPVASSSQRPPLSSTWCMKYPVARSISRRRAAYLYPVALDASSRWRALGFRMQAKRARVGSLSVDDA